MTKKTTAASTPPESAVAPARSKKDTILALTSREAGARLADIMAASDWQKHSVRGAISTMGKATKTVSSKDAYGARVYKAG
jgi:hypothetical protein